MSMPVRGCRRTNFVLVHHEDFFVRLDVPNCSNALDVTEARVIVGLVLHRGQG